MITAGHGGQVGVGLTPAEINMDGMLTYLTWSLSLLRGVVFSLEEGDSKEHLHIQGYMEFLRPIRFSTLQNAIKSGVHLETARGDREENFEYILHKGKHKDKGILHDSRVWGSWPSVSGSERNMYDEAVAMILEGQSILTIARDYKGAILPMIGNLQRLANEVAKKEELDITYLRKQEKERDNWKRWDENNEEIPF